MDHPQQIKSKAINDSQQVEKDNLTNLPGLDVTNLPGLVETNDLVSDCADLDEINNKTTNGNKAQSNSMTKSD